ncbi:MAG: NAD(P)/FAD-dependent oxidoreductase [Chroococcales cyanobacterium]
MSDQVKRLLIVGGVAGGASCAARARRLSETTEIVIFERGNFISFANCGLPYYVGDVITEEQKLLVATPHLFKQRFNIEVRLENEVVGIDRDAKEIEVKNLNTGEIYRESYDALVLSPGAKPIRPPLPGIDLPGIFALRTIPDSRQIRDWITAHSVKRAVIVGGGFIGLEMAENLVHRGIDVTLVENLPQVMSPLDPEMATPVHDHLSSKDVNLRLNDGVVGFETTSDGSITVKTKSGEELAADLVILGIGVRPETTLAIAAGLELGERGGIRVTDQMQTSDSSIWAVGDAVESQDFVTKELRLFL